MHRPSDVQRRCACACACRHHAGLLQNVNALILDSSCKVFSAGLDLKTMHGATNDELAHFWTAFRTLWMSIYDSRLATITAIQGPSPAGGCLMAIASDARIMSANANIGLNEAAFGLVVPVWGNTASERSARRPCLLARRKQI